MENKVKGRGRPKGSVGKPKVEKTRFSQYTEVKGPKIFTREYLNEKTGIKSTWYYDLDKFGNGPYRVENIFPEGYVDEIPQNDEDLPLTKREWVNPANGKMVGYTRAIQLGLFVPEKGSGKRGRPSKKK